MPTLTVSDSLSVGSIVGYITEDSTEATQSVIAVGIVKKYTKSHCLLTDIEDDRNSAFVPWSDVYLLHSLNDKKRLFKKGETCYALWQNVTEIEKKNGKKKQLTSFTTEYYKALYVRQDLRKKGGHIFITYCYGADGEFILPLNASIYDYEYPTVIKPVPAVGSELLAALLFTVDASDSDSDLYLPDCDPAPAPLDHAVNIEELETNNSAYFEKPAKTVETKNQRRKRRIRLILRSAQSKAGRASKGTSKTQISAAVKLEFMRRHALIGNASKVFRTMRKDGYNMGKSPRISDWVKNGVAHYEQLIADRGDVYKFSLKYVSFENVSYCFSLPETSKKKVNIR